MKKLMNLTVVMLFALPFAFIGCDKSEPAENPDVSNFGSEDQIKAELVYCGTPVVAPMVDYDQTISPATVSIGNDQTQLEIKYQLNEPGWFIYNARLFVGTEAQFAALPGINELDFDGSGTVHLSSSPPALPISSGYQSSGTTWSYVTDLSTLPDCFMVIAYMSIKNPSRGESMQIYGKSSSRSSGYYMNYCVQTCSPPPPLGGCETGYAFGEEFATCFIDIPGVNSNNWGWSNGPLTDGNYTWPIYAGAGQCNTANGTYVGTLDVNYTPPTATVTYTVFDGYVLNATHLHVGNQILPMKKNKYITAPGQFPYKHGNLNGVSTDTYNISGLSGNIYIVAHSEVCDDN